MSTPVTQSYRNLLTVRPPSSVLMAGQRRLHARRAADARDAITRVHVGHQRARGTGTELVRTGAAADTAASSVFYLAYAVGMGFFSFALFTGKYIFKTTHPVWGTVFALLTLQGLWTAGDKLNSGSKA